MDLAIGGAHQEWRGGLIALLLPFVLLSSPDGTIPALRVAVEDYSTSRSPFNPRLRSPALTWSIFCHTIAYCGVSCNMARAIIKEWETFI